MRRGLVGSFFKETGEKRCPAGVRWAFMVINDHNERSEKSQKVKQLVRVLQEKHYYQPDNIIFLGSEQVKREEQIFNELDILIQRINPGDTIVIHFSDETILDDARIDNKLGILQELGCHIII